MAAHNSGTIKGRNRNGARRRRSDQDGAGNEARTRDLDLGKVALYQLSYTRKWRPLGDSNPCYRRERAVSWASRRRGPGKRRKSRDAPGWRQGSLTGNPGLVEIAPHYVSGA